MNSEAIESLIASIELEARATANYTGRRQFKPSVLQALATIPRDQFVSSALRPRAYENTALSIDRGQTISQPFIVALMTDLLDIDDQATVLEIGTGSGYQSALLSQIAKKVISIELDEELGNNARLRLQRLGYDNVEVIVADGFYGCREYAPYDGIMVTAAIEKAPPDLIEQLKVGARLVVPIGKAFYTQELFVIDRAGVDDVSRKPVLPVVFVPFRRA